MIFDLQSARDQGHRDDEIAKHLADKLGYDYAKAIGAGHKPAQIAEYLTQRSVETGLPKPEVDVYGGVDPEGVLKERKEDRAFEEDLRTAELPEMPKLEKPVFDVYSPTETEERPSLAKDFMHPTVGGAAEAVVALGTGLMNLYATAPAGYAGFLALIGTGDVERSKDVIRRMTPDFAYGPPSEAGQRGVEAGMKPFEYLHKGAKKVGEKIHKELLPVDEVVAAAAGAIAEGLIDLSPMLLHFSKRGMKAIKRLPKKIQDSTYYRQMTVKERSLVALTYEQLKAAGVSDAKIAKAFPQHFKKLVAERKGGYTLTPDKPKPAPVVEAPPAPPVAPADLPKPKKFTWGQIVKESDIRGIVKTKDAWGSGHFLIKGEIPEKIKGYKAFIQEDIERPQMLDDFIYKDQNYFPVETMTEGISAKGQQWPLKNTAILQLKSGDIEVFVNKNYYDAVKANYPDSKLHINDNDYAVKFEQGGETVGVVMPLKSAGLDFTATKAPNDIAPVKPIKKVAPEGVALGKIATKKKIVTTRPEPPVIDTAKAARFNKMADTLQKTIDAKLDPGVSHQNLTARRARIAAGMREQGEALQALQAKLRAVAAQIENGTLPDSLEGIKNKKQLEYIWDAAKYEEKYGNKRKWPVSHKDDHPHFKESVKEQRKLLKSMGIENATQYNAAKADIKKLGKVEISPEQVREKQLRELEAGLIGKKIPGFFPTPKPIIADMIEKADIEAGMKVLEPSAGKGDIADMIKEIHPDADLSIIEISWTLRDILKTKGYKLKDNDFLEHKGKYDRIIMNPPFEKGQDMDHLRHAYSLLKDGGRVISIVGEGSFNRSDKKATSFRDWLDEMDGYGEKLKEKTFMGEKAFRQTGAAARMVILDKPEAVAAVQGMYVAPKKGDVGVFSALHDKMPRVEIDDSHVKLKGIKIDSLGIGEKYTDLGEVLDHPELFKRYPEMKNTLVTIMIDKDMQHQRGEFTPFIDRSTEGLTDLEPEIKIYAKDIEGAKGHLLHESQHIVQEIEDWARGGSPRAMQEYSDVAQRFATALESIIDEKLSQSANEEIMDYFWRATSGEISVDYLYKVAYELIPEEIAEDMYYYRKAKAQIGDAFELYQRLAGEVEARDTEARAGLTAKERLHKGYLTSEDIALEDMIVKKAGEVQASKPVTESPAFKEWFKGSKIVDKKGEPLVVYHGSGRAGIEKFDPSKAGTIQRSDWGEGIYFTPSKSTADYYRREALAESDPEGDRLYAEYEAEAKRLGTRPMYEGMDLGLGTPKYNQLKKVFDKWSDHREAARNGKGGGVYPSYISMKNPMIYQYVGITDPFLPEIAKGQGHDGIIIINEPWLEGPLADHIDEIIVFEPSQIKSISNHGAFDPADPRIQYSRQAYKPGEKYVPERKVAETLEGPIPTKPEALKKPLRKEDILEPLLKSLDTVLYEGKVKGRGILGFYKRYIEEVRIKNKSDIETAAHEIAHMLDDRIPTIRHSWIRGPKRKTHSKELKSISYDKKKVKEGFAEFVRLWMTQKEKVAELTPNYYEWFEGFIDTSDYGPALRKAQIDMHNWFEQGALARAKSKIGEQKSINTVHENIFDDLRQSIFDDLHGIYRAEKSVTGKIAPVGAYETARMTRAKMSIVDGVLDLGHIVVNLDGSHSYEGKGLREILKPVAGDIDNWTLYAVGRSAGELLAQGRENLFTAPEIQAMKSLETPEFAKVFEEYQEWNNKILDFAQKKNLINPDTRKLWKRMQYLPFRRVGKRGITKRKRGVEGYWGGIKALTGGTENIRDIVGNMIDNVSTLIGEGLNNEARLKTVALAKKPAGAKFITRIGKETRPLSISREQMENFVYDFFGINKKMVKMGMVPENIMRAAKILEEKFMEQPEFIRFWKHGQAPQGDNVVTAFRRGEPEFYEVVDPLLYRAITSLNRPTKNWLVRYMGAVRRLGQTSITLSVDFMTANIARDTVMAGILSKNGFRPFMDSIAGLKSRAIKDPAYKDWVANGGGYSSYLVDEAAFRKHMERFYTNKGIDYHTVLDTPSKVLFFLEQLADSFETATRLGEYKRGIKKELPARKAAYEAREVSTDFGMRGDSVVLSFFYDTVMFLKAGINGLDRLYRGVAHDANRATVSAKIAMLALFSTGLYLINKEIEDYQDMEDWDKDNHWHFFIPKRWLGQDQEGYTHFRYPKLWEVGAVGTIAERTAENIINQTPKKYAEDFSRVVMNQFKLDFTPQLIKPLYEQAKGKIGFLDRPIEAPWMEDLQPWARGYPMGNKFLRDIGEGTRKLPRALQLPPARTEALLRGYLNTWALYGLTLADAALYDDIPEMRVDQYPALRRFYQQKPARRTKYETMFYDMLREVTELRMTQSKMAKQKTKLSIAKDLARDARLGIYKPLSEVSERLGMIRKQMEDAYADDKMTPAQKRDEIDRLVEIKNRLLKNVMKAITEKKEEMDATIR